MQHAGSLTFETSEHLGHFEVVAEVETLALELLLVLIRDHSRTHHQLSLIVEFAQLIVSRQWEIFKIRHCFELDFLRLVVVLCELTLVASDEQEVDSVPGFIGTTHDPDAVERSDLYREISLSLPGSVRVGLLNDELAVLLTVAHVEDAGFCGNNLD